MSFYENGRFHILFTVSNVLKNYFIYYSDLIQNTDSSLFFKITLITSLRSLCTYVYTMM